MTAVAPTPSGVPMLDVNRQNGPLAAEFEAAIAEIARTGSFVHGPACKTFEAQIAEYCNVEHAIGCASGSDALLLALMALQVGPGDEVVLPSFTFFATASSVTRLGATPVFADILPETFNIDPADVARKITSRTKAIMPVHLFGQAADMDGLAAAAPGLPIVEDACQAIGAEYRGAKVGGLGAVGCFSFYPTKNLGGWGDGGLMTTNDAKLAAALRVLRDHGQSPRYHHSLVGINSRLDAIQAAVLSVKLPRLDACAARRDANARRYAAQFVRTGLDRSLQLPQVAPGCSSVWNQFTVRVPGGRRDALQQFLNERKIGSAVYYPIPLHLQECFAAWGCQPGSLPVTEQAAREVLSLPIYEELTRAEQDAVIGAVAEFCGAQPMSHAA
ncbi:MAG TPA: DegT/DnrJ/EryC1/StrS family aminotransferase [Lacipirellulaceae bacterium]|nr:DegT/DnrJ/EryC1/StrS family aminotransferase [Lacipirellulaceae bacterium]